MAQAKNIYRDLNRARSKSPPYQSDIDFMLENLSESDYEILKKIYTDKKISIAAGIAEGTFGKYARRHFKNKGEQLKSEPTIRLPSAEKVKTVGNIIARFKEH